MRIQQEQFLNELNSVDPVIGSWAADKFAKGMTVRRVREELKALMKLAQPERRVPRNEEAEKLLTALDSIQPNWMFDLADFQELQAYARRSQEDEDYAREMLRDSVSARGYVFIRAALQSGAVVIPA